MQKKTQKEAFLDYEGNNWFLRNKTFEYRAENDPVIKVLIEYKLNAQSVLEIGCSYGYRLNANTKIFSDTNTTGIEPSEQAIHLGQSLYDQVRFIHGTADDMPALSSGSFDLVVIGFVLYVVDREILLRVVAEVDRVLKDGGILMIVDFFSERPVRNSYQHIKNIDAYAYKQNYDEIFTASKLYQLIDKRSMSHSHKGYDLTGDYYDKYVLTTLRKDLSAGYK
jgi:ubiquinone/menaquinone biosynthesis C-methylase UbiE